MDKKKAPLTEEEEDKGCKKMNQVNWILVFFGLPVACPRKSVRLVANRSDPQKIEIRTMKMNDKKRVLEVGSIVSM